MASTLDKLPDAAAVKAWSPDEQASWAEEYGATLWNTYGDDSIAASLSGDEKEADRKKAWNTVYSEHESRIHHDIGEVADGESHREDALLQAVHSGFKQAYNSA